MADFFAALLQPEIPFLRLALAVGLLASVAFGIIGSYVVARRISYLAGAIAHSVLGGIGCALYLQKAKGYLWMEPVYGAVTAALLSALLIGLVSLYAKQREDTVIGAIWSIGMAVGLLFIAKTPGYVEPMSYLFGNILLLTSEDIWMVVGLDLIIVLAGVIFYHKLLAVCFDEEFARLRGIPVQVFYLLLLGMTALTIVLLVRVVGIVMVVALLTLPAAVASYFVRSLWQMMVLATVLCMLFIGSGLSISFNADLPAGPSIIMVAGVVYILIASVFSLKKRVIV
ncbi:MAG: metal ABC transporter permease [Deltaproteobacteria bacterium]